MQKFKSILLIIVLAISVLSCKKEKVNNPPQIYFNAPLENTLLNAIDTVLVDCNVSDDNAENLTVSVYIVNSQMQAVTSPYIQTYNGSHAHVYVYYDFSNRWLDGGTYYLAVQASDGNSSTKAFVKINIAAIPKKFCGMVVGVQNQQGCDVYVCDTTFAFNKKLSFSSVLKGCFNPYAQSIEVLLSSGTIEAYSMDYYQQLYSKSGLNKIGSPFNGDLTVKYPYTYVTNANGFIYAYDENGIVRASTTTLFSPFKLLNWANEWIVLSSDYPPSYYWIQIPPLSVNSAQSTFNFSDLLPLDDTHCLVISQQNQSVQMMTFNLQNKYLNTSFGQAINGQYNGGIFVNNQLYISVGTNLYSVDKTSGSVFSVFNGIALSNIKWEDVNNYMYGVNQNNIYVILPTQISIQNTFTLPGNIVFYDFIYK